MRKAQGGVIVLSMLLGVTGCARITTQVVEKPRVDQELAGNRGYFAGTPPPATTQRPSTRQVIQTDIELPTAQEMNPWKIKKAAPAAETPARHGWEESSADMESPPATEAAPESAAPATTYTVKSGDTLERIASKVYGDGKQWNRIYKANKDRLSSPNKLKVGQELVIPPGQGAAHTAGHHSTSDLK